MDVESIPLTTIEGGTTTLGEIPASAYLVVNVASRCGYTPQYAALERLHETYRDRGLAVLGFPSNQFLQELGSDEKVAEFCSMNYGVTFPMFERVKVNGSGRHPLFAELVEAEDDNGKAGRVKWNFEKFLVSSDGTVRRFRSAVEPDDPAVIDAIESALPAA